MPEILIPVTSVNIFDNFFQEHEIAGKNLKIDLPIANSNSMFHDIIQIIGQQTHQYLI